MCAWGVNSMHKWFFMLLHSDVALGIHAVHVFAKFEFVCHCFCLKVRMYECKYACMSRKVWVQYNIQY